MILPVIHVIILMANNYFVGKRRSSRLNAQEISEDNKECCYVCHCSEDEVVDELLQCSKCLTVGN